MDPTRVNEHEREQEGGMGRVHDMSDVYPSSDTLVFSGAREKTTHSRPFPWLCTILLVSTYLLTCNVA